MREHKGEVDTQIRDLVPDLVIIVGDTCPHVHNIAKKFTDNFFDICSENMFRQIYTDLKALAYSMEMLKAIAHH